MSVQVNFAVYAHDLHKRLSKKAEKPDNVDPPPTTKRT